MSWYYQGIEVVDLPEDIVGYVYCITNLTNNRKYIGKKLAKFSKTTYKTVKQKNGIKKKKKIRTKIDSDWRDYYVAAFINSLLLGLFIVVIPVGTAVFLVSQSDRVTRN